MNPDTSWPAPSPAAAELIRATTAALLRRPDDVFAELDAAVLARQPRQATLDEQVTAAIRTSNRANLAHWGAANLREPGARVRPIEADETLEIGREIVRRGLDDTSLEAYRLGQNVAWRRWMQTAFSLCSDPRVLGEMLDITARSIFAFVDDTLAAIHAAMDEERAQLVSRTHTERLEVVNLLLEHAPITAERASQRLRYELSGRHTAAIVWSDRMGPRDPGELEAAANALRHRAASPPGLSVAPTADALWVWMTTPVPPELDELRSASLPEGVRAAIGTTDSGLDGFRRSHLNALSAQRLMRRMPQQLPVAAFADVQLVDLVAQDEERVGEFLGSTLGPLTRADAVLAQTLRVFVRERFSASATARALFTHRNTVLGRLQRARRLLPVSLEEHGLEVGLALEVLHWLGPPAGRG
ncbi:MAG TPA: helix-turn-helix domain-containing protein [Solirubrobacteraceae bacterium]|nr:helix-turn-helix domain-containing protein [Solirubrobacteraceae bacterium]